MAPAMKLTMRWEEGETSLHTMLKITLPKGWKDGPTSNLKKTFVEHYNKKFPNNQLKGENIHLVNPKGEQLADDDVVLKVLDPSDTVRVKRGKPPQETQKVISKAAPSSSGRVTNAADLMKAKDEKFAFDYSKWDRLDLSDDDGADCHPNIDLESWKRLRGRQRSERREVEDRKVQRYKAKITKYEEKTDKLQKRLDKLNKSEDVDEEKKTQLEIDLEDAKTSKAEYEYKLKQFLASLKLTADDVCEVTESKGLVAENADYDPTTNYANDVKPKSATSEATTEKLPGTKAGTSTKAGKIPTVEPESKDQEYDSYDAFQKDHRPLLKRFAQMRSDEQSEEFLLKHPSLLCDHAEGFLLILTLDTCMKHKLLDDDPTKKRTADMLKLERLKEFIVAKQHLTVHYICELGKSMHRKPIEAVKPFFRKTGPKAEDKVEGFKEDLEKFLERIRNRAKEKISKGEIRSLVDDESSLVEFDQEEIYQRADVGPGGLDPNEVLQSLPEELQMAFIEQDLEKLKTTFETLPQDEAEYHLQRCIDSGLWVPGGAEDDEDDEEDPEKTEGATITEIPEKLEAVAPAQPTVDDVE